MNDYAERCRLRREARRPAHAEANKPTQTAKSNEDSDYSRDDDQDDLSEPDSD